MKNKFINFYFDVAQQTAKLSHAVRLKVGAVIVKDNNIISFGYNGMPAGMTNQCEEEIYDDREGIQVKTKLEVIHAEANAITKLARQNGNGQGSIMFITHSPCVECAKLIIQSGITDVYWKKQYRDKSGAELLQAAGLKTFYEEE
jgi:dCMP deaminase